MIALSVLIPARNEMFLARTIQDLLENTSEATEIIAICDGNWPDPPVPDNERVRLIYHPEPIGQRAATNEAARIAQGKYLIKMDAHCAVDKDFDTKMLSVMQDDWTLLPTMRNLHVFDWVCPNGHRRYQGPSGVCKECGEPTTMDVVWIAKTNPASRSFCFDSEPHFQYFNEYMKRPEVKGKNLTESMSVQGSCWMLTRDRYFDLNICDESFGIWGSQGIEVACKSWLSGGKVMVYHDTWYAHAFRTQGGDWGFPYPIGGKQVAHAKQKAREQFFDGKWEGAKLPLSWLVEKFLPVNGWSDEDLAKLKGEVYVPPVIKETTKEILYYTCLTHSQDIEMACRAQLLKAGLPIVSVSLNKPIDFGNNFVMEGERGAMMMHRQILKGLQESKADIVFLCESDVLYHPSHFEYMPKRNDVFYYDVNVWKVRYPDGHAVWTDDLQQVSGVCAYRELLLDFYTKRLAQIEREGFNRHYEPGLKQTIYGYHKGGKYGVQNYSAKVPNICIRHDHTLTKSKWSVDEYRNKEYAKGWTEADEVEGWGDTKVLMEDIKNGNRRLS